jgi:CheY-like chemotaxis protein
MVWNEIRHRARLVKDYGQTPTIDANESRLGQVFLNLLVNAAQAIPEGNAERNEIRIVTRAKDGWVVIDISDTGAGIPPERLARIFEPFFTTKPVGEGTGLGLSICHGIVGSLGGEITVSSRIGEGTTFQVTLPVGRLEEREQADVQTRPIRASRRARILVVDDEAMMVKALTRTLRSHHDVTGVTAAREAARLIEAGERYDLILCDLMMPQITGMDLHTQLLRAAPEMAAKMIFLTGGAFTVRARTFLDNVPNQRLEKPFDPMGLLALIRDLVA